jgi:hypothetical protein
VCSVAHPAKHGTAQRVCTLFQRANDVHAVQCGFGVRYTHLVCMRARRRRKSTYTAPKALACSVCSQPCRVRIPAPVPLCSEQCAAQLTTKTVDDHERAASETA